MLSKGRTERSAHLARLRLRDTQDMSETDPRREYIRQAIVHALGPPADWVSHKVAGSAICVLLVLPGLAYERVRRHSIHQRVLSLPMLSVASLQERLVQQTYSYETALSAFLEDVAVDLLQAYIAVGSDGSKLLKISTAIDCAPGRTFQVLHGRGLCHVQLISPLGRNA